MTTYDWPSTITPTSMSIGIEDFTRTFESPFTGAVQTASRGRARLKVRITCEGLTGDDRAVMIAFLAKISDLQHRFRIKDYSHTQRGAFTGASNPLVNGAGQTGQSLNIDNCEINVTNWLRAGDRFRVGNEYKIVLDDVNTNASGQAKLTFRPPLRNSPADNSQVVVGPPINGTAEPAGVFLLSQPMVDWSSGSGVVFSDFVLEAIEDVLA